MKILLLSLCLAGAAFAQEVKVIPLYMDRTACTRFVEIVGFKPCIQHIHAIAVSPSRDVTGFEITVEYTDALGARRSQVAVVKAAWQDGQTVGSYFFQDVDDVKDIKATAVALSSTRAGRR